MSLDYDVQVCIVSDQPLPNLMAALDPVFGRERIILLESPRMRARAEALEKVLRRRGKTVARRPIADDGDLPAFRRRAQEILGEFPASALNATGGQKTMSLLAYEVWRGADRPVFYVERDNRLLWLHPLTKPAAWARGGLGIHDYFAAFGQTLADWREAPDPHDGTLQSAKPILSTFKPASGNPKNAGRKFESQVFRIAQEALAASNPRDHAETFWSVRTAGEAPDELDIVAVRDGALFIIECKNTVSKNDFNLFLNKLETMRMKRGLTARAALVTTAHVPPEAGSARRARETGILLIGRDGLSRLPEALRRWFAGEKTA